MRKRRVKRYVRSDGTVVRSYLRRMPVRGERRPTEFLVEVDGQMMWVGAHQLEKLQQERGRAVEVLGNNITMGAHVYRSDTRLGDTQHVKSIAELAEERAKYSRVSEQYDPSLFHTLDTATKAEASYAQGYFKQRLRAQRDRRRNFGLKTDFEYQAANLLRKSSTELSTEAAETAKIVQNLQSMAKAVEVAAPLSADEEKAIRRHWNM